MYADSTSTFRDPFASIAVDNFINRLSHQHHLLPNGRLADSAYIDLSRPPTPPPEMNRAGHAPIPASCRHELDLNYPNLASRRSAYRGGYPYDDAWRGTGSRPLSPALQPRVTAAHEPQFEPNPQRRASQVDTIAPSFQIPKAVNDSGGSLSELAAQITCLFWFESADLLQRVEEVPLPILTPRCLVRDALPTTGFRKWVTTILSTTLVGPNVVLLALLFIHRLKKLNPTVNGKPGSEYRLLTVALMLGNKFLDDNTYTNKTWAEVSGINVAEVHIMEVEFLSNMKYCLYTSREEWAEWQALLGRYAAFFDRATNPRPPPSNPPAPILPPASLLRLPAALPSPPASTQASPPFAGDSAPKYAVPAPLSHGPTPAPSPLTLVPAGNRPGEPPSRKRGREDAAPDLPRKRFASGVADMKPGHYAAAPTNQDQDQRLTLPSLSIPTGQASTAPYSMPPFHAQQLPPLNVPARAMAMVFPKSGAPASTPQHAAAGPASSQAVPQQLHAQYQQSRQQSPYPASSASSPANDLPPSATILQPPAQVSPSYFLQQRNSPYRPVHNVSTLLYPPPSAALQPRPQNIEFDQMHYQPLGKPSQLQTGRLPYVAPNSWLDGGQQQATGTPAHNWRPFSNFEKRHPVPRQGV